MLIKLAKRQTERERDMESKETKLNCDTERPEGGVKLNKKAVICGKGFITKGSVEENVVPEL